MPRVGNSGQATNTLRERPPTLGLVADLSVSPKPRPRAAGPRRGKGGGLMPAHKKRRRRSLRPAASDQTRTLMTFAEIVLRVLELFGIRF